MCRLFLLFLLFITASVVATEAEFGDSKALHSKPPKFATSTVKPWGYRDELGRESGLLVNFSRELWLETGVAYRNYLQPYPRVIHSLSSGAVDFAVLFDSPQARQSAIRVGDVVDVEIVVVAKKGAERKSSLSELAGMEIGYIRGSKYGIEFDNATHFTRIPINKMSQGLAMLLNGRIDAMASADQSLYWTMDRMGVDASELVKVISVGETTGGLYMSRYSTYQHLAPIYKKALQRMEAKGTMARIFYHQDAWASIQNRINSINQ